MEPDPLLLKNAEHEFKIDATPVYGCNGAGCMQLRFPRASRSEGYSGIGVTERIYFKDGGHPYGGGDRLRC